MCQRRHAPSFTKDAYSYPRPFNNAYLSSFTIVTTLIAALSAVISLLLVTNSQKYYFAEMTDSEESFPSDIEGASTIYFFIHFTRNKLRVKYELTYERFLKWCKGKKLGNIINEKVLIPYLEYLFYKPSSLWAYIPYCGV